MGKKYRHVINILLASTLYLNSIFYLPAFAQSTTGTSPTWEIKASELQSNLMVNTTGSPDHVVKKKLIWAMSFSIFGGLSALACQNLKAYDVDLWVLGGAYYTVRALMLKSKETKVAEAIANAQKQETQYYQENPDIKAQREKQIKPLEQILEAQRQAISLMESQNQLLKHMKISYYTALGVLATLIILSKTPCGPPPGKCSAFLGIKDTDDLKCNKQNSKELTRAMKTIKTIITDIGGTLLIIQQGFSVIKSLTSLHQVSPEFNRVVVAHNEEVKFMMSCD
jgi:hypothetical protein